MRLVPVLAGFLCLTACHGNAAASPGDADGTRRFAVAGPVHAIDQRAPDDVRVVHGATLSVVATGPQRVLYRLQVHVEQGRLIVERPGILVTPRGATITVTLPHIDAASLDGSGNLSLDRADGPSFAGVLAGSGDLSIAALDLPQASLQIGGSGDLRASGHVGTLAVAVRGSGTAKLDGLASQNATLSLIGSGDIATGPAVAVTGALHGSGDITVAGHPRCTISKSGSGDVSCG